MNKRIRSGANLWWRETVHQRRRLYIRLQDILESPDTLIVFPMTQPASDPTPLRSIIRIWTNIELRRLTKIYEYEYSQLSNEQSARCRRYYIQSYHLCEALHCPVDFIRISYIFPWGKDTSPRHKTSKGSHWIDEGGWRYLPESAPFFCRTYKPEKMAKTREI